MIAQLDWQGHGLRIDLARGRSIAIDLDPHGPQPSFFTDRAASARPLQSGDYIGDVRQGGSCNAEVVELIPHCHGTHTECLGHVQAETANVQETIYAGPTLARLISLLPKTGNGTHPEFTLESLQEACTEPQGPPVEALVIRTLPNDPDRCRRDYAAHPGYAVLAPQAMQWLAAQPLKHLLLDSPSLDPAHDGGRLANHHNWWGLTDATAPPGINPGARSVTEMIFVPDEIGDGLRWLQLELSPLLGDATPSRPILYPVEVAP